MKSITQQQIQQLRAELESMSYDASSHSDLELDSYLQFQRNISGAAKAVIASNEYRNQHPVNIANVSSLYRLPPNSRRSQPDGCIVCLEDMKGGVARDSQGRPIIYMIGMLHGDEEELKQQLSYVLQRAACYRLPHQRPDEVCFVTQVWNRETNFLYPSFRFPDAAVRSLFDYLKQFYPGAEFSVLHFCGVPSFVAAFFKMVRPFMSEEMYSRLNVKSNTAHLLKEGHMTTDNLLPEWDPQGTFQFNLDDYVDWRAHEERVMIRSDQTVCPRGQGRSYKGKLEIPQASVLTTKQLLGSSEAREKVMKSGWADKRGSGLGLFASNRWKRKFVILTQGLLTYFESSKISSSNHASRTLFIDKSSSVMRLLGSNESSTDSDSKRAVICLQSSQREFVFGFASEEEAEEWVQIIQKQILAAKEEDDDGGGGGEQDDSLELQLHSSVEHSGVNPSSVSSLCVGDFHICQKDRRLTATVRQ